MKNADGMLWWCVDYDGTTILELRERHEHNYENNNFASGNTGDLRTDCQSVKKCDRDR